MIRTSIAIVTFVLTGMTLAAQVRADERGLPHHVTAQDTSLIDQLNKSALRLRFTSTDSGLYYSLRALELSQELHDPERTLQALLNVAMSNQTLGNRTTCMRFALEGKKRAEELGDSVWISKFQIVIGVENYYVGQYSEARRNLEHAYRVFHREDRCDQFIAQTWMGFTLAQMGEIESAKSHCKAAMSPGEHDPCRGFRNTPPIWHLGTISLMEDQPDSAFYYFSLIVRNAGRDTKFKSDAALQMAGIFRDRGQLDSCLSYATLALRIAQHAGSLPEVRNAYLFFEQFYENRDPVKALEYGREAMVVSDSLEALRYKTTFEDITRFDAQRRQAELAAEKRIFRNQIIQRGLIVVILIAFGVALILQRNNKLKENANRELSETLRELKNTQSQLIHAEKMASLGELTAGIAHEIQNPLNFVNNFAEINKELLEEIREAIAQHNPEEAASLVGDIIDNEEKIAFHGKRADAIVKSMLMHSRTSTGNKEPTDLNALADEYLRLAYHGLRAKDKTFNADFQTDLDPTLPLVSVIPQDLGRVLLNFINNAFYAVSEKARAGIPGYAPTVIVRTKKRDGIIKISVIDNGNGIPPSIKEKIFQPFYTTKPTGQGTGLGLSLSYDIIKAHNGEIKVATQENEGTEFTIQLSI